MTHKIGFVKEDYDNKMTEEKRERMREEKVARKSVVQVYFQSRGNSYS